MRSKRGIPYFELLIMLCVTGLTLVPSYVALGGITRQLRSMGYPSVLGTITHSSVAVSRDSDGDPTYQFSVRYVYRVEGRRYEGTQARYSAWRTASQSFVEELAARFPEKSTVPVYYRPEAPEDAVLIAGLQSTELMVMLVMMPFAFVVGGGWYALGRRRSKAEGLHPVVRDGRTHVTLRDTFPFVRALVTSGGCAVLLAIILALGWNSNPPVQAMLAAWVLMVASGVIAWQLTRVRQARGRYDLILDEPSRRLLLPPGPERKQPLELAWKHIAAVKCVPHTFEDPDGDKVLVWRPVLELTRSRGGHSEVLTQWSDQARAEALTDWLRSRLGC